MYRELSQLKGAIGLTFSLFVGCAFDTDEALDAPGVSDVRSLERPILSGQVSGRESVVLVRSAGPDRTNLCTGTLVAPNLVITARHCVSAMTDGTYFCTIEGEIDLTRPRTPANAGEMGLVYPAEMITVHGGTVPDEENALATAQDVISPETTTICRNDLAFIILDRDVSLPIETLRLDEGVFPGDEVTVIGYGINDVRRTERHELGGVEVLAVGESDFFPQAGNALPRTFVLGRSGCPGDSGGPALSDDTGELLGVFSLSRGDCESAEVRNIVTQVAPFRSIVVEAFETAGHAELLVAPDPPGDGGSGDGLPMSEPKGGAQDPAGCSCEIKGTTNTRSYGSRFVAYTLTSLAVLAFWRRRRLHAASIAPRN